ncbi:hypothetical protein Pan216_49970 [Planctomycetes bacterium Pan216]|uniref:Uncharacterized protein n=1 Tax=Kolteria novifilia TaxID=2527975 RepID=A0A518BAU9_9BACT|nr:hypothetical protein Pan216_49970 [Planctomycetes bacterium Pan216]
MPSLLLALLLAAPADEPLPIVSGVEAQPLAAQVRRLLDALDYLGQPLPEDDRRALETAMKGADGPQAVRAIQEILDKHALVGVTINPESRVKVAPGAAPRQLVEQGWRNFLVKVINEAGITSRLRVESPNAAPMVKRSRGAKEPTLEISPDQVRDRFLDATMFDDQPMTKSLSGLGVEYRLLQLFCRDVGKREATLAFDVGQGTQDLGFRSEVALLFDSLPASPVTLRVLDHDGEPTMAWFRITDKLGRVYPSQTRRLAPDFFFHPQVYRGDGETIPLPAGTYTVEFGRGPEYHIDSRTLVVPEKPVAPESFRLRRWVEPKSFGWWSGDHHVHGAGCAHYENPTQGVKPEDMFRHALGEDLNVACVLSWGPCWYFQKQYFDGKVHQLSEKDYLLRYDVEVSGFPSSHAGHLVLLNLGEDDYPGTERIEDWPSWDLPILKWAKAQGGVVGFAHSGWGLDLPDDTLPSDVVPPFSGIGANEYIVDITHDACDFISTVDTPAPWELNIWYHTLNCGYRCRISGETDFPCIYGERVGLGRVYVKVDGELNYPDWVQGLKDGRSYVSDGLSHLLDFTVDDVAVGEKGSQLDLESPKTVTITAKVSALLGEKPDEVIRTRPLSKKPYWHVERARVGATRTVPVEVVMNGRPVASKTIVADGSLQTVSFDVPVEKSSWVALRVYPSSHTNPVFIEVDGKPIRASRKSAEWCLKGVERCWEQKRPKIRGDELEAARDAYEHARQAYRRRLNESETE